MTSARIGSGVDGAARRKSPRRRSLIAGRDFPKDPPPPPPLTPHPRSGGGARISNPSRRPRSFVFARRRSAFTNARLSRGVRCHSRPPFERLNQKDSVGDIVKLVELFANGIVRFPAARSGALSGLARLNSLRTPEARPPPPAHGGSAGNLTSNRASPASRRRSLRPRRVAPGGRRKVRGRAASAASAQATLRATLTAVASVAMVPGAAASSQSVGKSRVRCSDVIGWRRRARRMRTLNTAGLVIEQRGDVGRNDRVRHLVEFRGNC